MGFRTILTVALLGSASAALGQTPPAPAAVNPLPPAPTITNAPAPLPKIVQPKPARHVNRKPRGEPIVKGNTDIFVDSYGQLSTTMQP